MKKKRKLLFGKKMLYTKFGRKGCSRGNPNGSFNYYLYGIKGLIGIEVKETCGVFSH